MSAIDAAVSPKPDPGAGLTLVMPGRSVSAGAGWRWIAEGWRIFTQAPLMWILSMVVLIIVMIVMNLVPILGGLAFQLLQTVIWAGFIAACRALETGGDFEIEHLMAGFTHRFGSLMGVSLIFVGLGIVLAMAYFGAVGFSVVGAALSGDNEAVRRALLGSVGIAVIGALVVLLVAVPLVAAYWFAPALVFMHGVGPVESMKASLGACLRNIVPFLVYGLIMFVLLIIAMIPFGLGMLVMIPLSITSAYASYRDIFTEEPRAAPATTMA
jgi:uncharacterized membrane protein